MINFRIVVGMLLAGAPCMGFTQNLDAYVGWHKEWNDTLKGINLPAARQFMQDYKIRPKRTVIIGIIDSGIEPGDQSVAGSLWTNKKEKLNGKDDDGNGYVDDVHGWNFLGTKDGTFNMTSAGTEEFREFKRLYPKYKNVNEKDPQVEDEEEYKYYLRMKKKAGIAGYIRFYGYAQQKNACIDKMDSILHIQPQLAIDTLTLGGMMHQEVADTLWSAYAEAILADLLRADRNMLWKDFVKKQHDDLKLMARRIYGIEHDADKRLLMGDNMEDAEDLFYGNNTLNVEGHDHGHFVATVVAGRSVDSRRDGIWPAAKLLTVRCAPNGDEYDKDVSSAIRYAVDNGAKVLNISLGKYTSPRADMVNAALEYAASKDVLVITAGGNNHLNIDTTYYYPTAIDAHGRPLSNVIRVGGSAMDGSLSSISNFGSERIDLYAPGEYIAGFYPGDKPDMANGTSVAAPVVSGVAAMLRACFPKLKAPQLKQILMTTVHKMPGLKCVSGGIVDAYAALKMAANKR
ncbi:peptidase, S8/S53 family [Bacteroidales bacterium KA00344]|nr:peptidase, S8/S53 family [Bacteroidales bacterium KA00344]